MKQKLLRIALYQLRIAAVVMVLLLPGILLVSAKAEKFYLQLWQQLGISKQESGGNIKETFMFGFIYHGGFKSIKNIVTGDRVGVAEDLLEYTKTYVYSDEMSKVYRSMLSSGNEQLVEVETELNILRSYFYLLKERYGEGLHLDIDVHADECRQLIPPLTLQILFEKIISCNIIRKEQPLMVKIYSGENCRINIRHNVQPKIYTVDPKTEAAFENIANKFKLLCRQDVVVTDTIETSIIELPLIRHTETTVV